MTSGRVEDPQQRQNEMVNFMKNMAMLGAAMALMAVEEPWPASVPIGQPKLMQRVRKFGRNIAA